ncbi:MAG: hypothetical protein U9P14_10245, partial [Gemmatimonadota bacterium]|nr:hypothetical protein [Gemmatimonadota bacterium]
CLSVAAASIVAKVTRDRLMQQFDLQYPGYGFARHKGYGTADHLRALNELGPCPIHRRSFEVVAQVEKAKNTEKEVDMENMGSNLSDQYAFFLEALENSSTMNELDRIGSDIRLVRDSLTVEELNLLRAAYRRRKEILS